MQDQYVVFALDLHVFHVYYAMIAIVVVESEVVFYYYYYNCVVFVPCYAWHHSYRCV